MIAETAAKLRENIQKVIVGKDEIIDLALIAMLCEGHILLEDVPGTGKTTLAKTIAASLGCTFRRVQFTPDLLPSDVTGIYYYNQKAQEFEFRAGPVFAQILLADEINRATPRTQSALLEAMQERQVTVDIATHKLPRPFLVLATQNPVELEGTFPLPEAQLDRFLLKVALGYPDANEENDILLRFERVDPLDSLENDAKVRLLRDNVVIHEGELSQLKHFKEDAREIREGFECGIALASYQDIQVGNRIECFEIEEVARQL